MHKRLKIEPNGDVDIGPFGLIGNDVLRLIFQYFVYSGERSIARVCKTFNALMYQLEGCHDFWNFVHSDSKMVCFTAVVLAEKLLLGALSHVAMETRQRTYNKTHSKTVELCLDRLKITSLSKFRGDRNDFEIINYVKLSEDRRENLKRTAKTIHDVITPDCTILGLNELSSKDEILAEITKTKHPRKDKTLVNPRWFQAYTKFPKEKIHEYLTHRENAGFLDAVDLKS